EPLILGFFERRCVPNTQHQRPQPERALQVFHPDLIWFGFSLSRVRTKTCPLFQTLVWMPLASPATPARNRRARLASQPHLAWVFVFQGADQNLSAFSIARLNAARIPRDSGEKSRNRWTAGTRRENDSENSPSTGLATGSGSHSSSLAPGRCT